MRASPPSLCLAALVGLAGGCAFRPPAYDLDEMVRAYHEARAGARGDVYGDHVRFCAGEGGVRLTRAWSETWDNTLDVTPDAQVVDGVREVLAADPQLRGQDIHATVDDGGVLLRGRVRSDALAMRAARDAVEVAGVVLVNVQLASPESPLPPPAHPRDCW